VKINEIWIKLWKLIVEKKVEKKFEILLKLNNISKGKKKKEDYRWKKRILK
jgi:hypothetical protein